MELRFFDLKTSHINHFRWWFKDVRWVFCPWRLFWVPCKRWSWPRWWRGGRWWQIRSFWCSSFEWVPQWRPVSFPFVTKFRTVFFFVHRATWFPFKDFRRHFYQGVFKTPLIKVLTGYQLRAWGVPGQDWWSKWSKWRRQMRVYGCWDFGTACRWIWYGRWSTGHRSCSWFRLRTCWQFWGWCRLSIFGWPLWIRKKCTKDLVETVFLDCLQLHCQLYCVCSDQQGN